MIARKNYVNWITTYAKNIEKYYESLKEDFIGDFNSPGRCAGAFLGASIQNVGALSWGMVSETDFRKNDCT